MKINFIVEKYSGVFKFYHRLWEKQDVGKLSTLLDRVLITCYNISQNEQNKIKMKRREIK